MKKKTAPIITYTEILARAIRTIEAEIEGWKVCFPLDKAEALFTKATAELVAKMDALKQLYSIETGTDYE